MLAVDLTLRKGQFFSSGKLAFAKIARIINEGRAPFKMLHVFNEVL